MKLILKSLRVLLVIVVSCLSTVSGMADENVNLAHWLRDMPDNMRLTQMSIPLAHDAATWKSGFSWWNDQLLKEYEQFDKGVRAFDIRLSLLEDGDIKTCHSTNTLNSIDDEVNNCFPTAAQLGDTDSGEFILLNVKYDDQTYNLLDTCRLSGYELFAFKRKKDREGFHKFLKLLIKRYGRDRFIYYRKDLTAKELRGKILLFAYTQLTPKNFCGYDYGNDFVPINAFDNRNVTNEKGDLVPKPAASCPNKDIYEAFLVDCYIMNYNSSSTAERNDPNSPIVAEKVWMQHYCESNRSSETMASYFKWSEDAFHDSIDLFNTQNILLEADLNGWKFPNGGISTAADYVSIFGDSNGANHLAYQYIRDMEKPLGLVGMDFCGSDKAYSRRFLKPYYYLPYGETLTTEIVRHNYIQKRLMAEKPEQVPAHSHNASIEYAFDESSHYKICTICGQKFDVAPHNFVYKKGINGYEHFASCDCGYSGYEDCAARTTFDETGFGTCSVCQQETYQPAVHKEKVYQISNAGQLYWFSQFSTFTDPSANAVLTNDIDFNPQMKVVDENSLAEIANDKTLREWSPIAQCSDTIVNRIHQLEDSLGVDLSSVVMGYKGTFDGQGYVIRGLKIVDNIDDDKYRHGLFGYIHGGTVKNVGIENSCFSGNDRVGSIAGQVEDGTIKNVYCRNSLINLNELGISVNGGGLVGSIAHSTLKNAYFDGLLMSKGLLMGSNRLSPLGFQYASRTNYGGYLPLNVTNFLNSLYFCDISNVYVKEGKYAKVNFLNVTAVPDSLFTNGTLCYMLNDSTYDENAMWHQNIDASEIVEGGYQPDNAPVLYRSHSMVVPAHYNGKDFINLNVQYDNGAIHYSRDNFNVSDKNDYSCPVDFDVNNATQTRDMTGYMYGTVCLPFDIVNTDYDDILLYTLNTIFVSNGRPIISINEIEKLPACVPGIFAKMNDAVSTIEFVSGGKTTVSKANHDDRFNIFPDNIFSQHLRLVGSFTSDTVYYDNIWNVYGFNSATDEFIRLNVGDKLISKPFRGWMVDYNSQFTSYPLRPNTDPITAVDDVEADDLIINAKDLDLPIYDTSGRRVLYPYNGQVIIRKGKKKVYNNK